MEPRLEGQFALLLEPLKPPQNVRGIAWVTHNLHRSLKEISAAHGHKSNTRLACMLDAAHTAAGTLSAPSGQPEIFIEGESTLWTCFLAPNPLAEEHSIRSCSTQVGVEIQPGSAQCGPRLNLKPDLIAMVEAALRGNAPKPLVSRIQWLQRGSNLAWLAGAMCLGFALGLQELGQGHLGWAAGWWLVMPVMVICLALSGLQRILRGEGCLPCTRSIPVIVVTAIQPVDYKRHRVGVLPRARDSIP